MNITLQTIRDATNFDELKPCIQFLCNNKKSMTWSEFQAFNRMLEIQAVKINSSVRELNAYAEGYNMYYKNQK